MIMHIKIVSCVNLDPIAWKQRVACPDIYLWAPPALPTRETPRGRVTFPQLHCQGKYFTHAGLTRVLSLGFLNCKRERKRFDLLLCGWTQAPSTLEFSQGHVSYSMKQAEQWKAACRVKGEYCSSKRRRNKKWGESPNNFQSLVLEPPQFQLTS